MILDKCVHTWQHLYDQSSKHSHHLQKCPYVLVCFSVCVCVCVVKRLNKGPMLLTYLNVNNTVLLVISIMFYSRSLKCTHFAYLKLNACWSVTPHFSFLPGPGHYKCILCFCVLDYFIYLIKVDSCSVCSSLSTFFHLAWYHLGSSMLIQMVRFPSFIRLNNVSWYVSVVFSFFNVHLLMEIWLVSVSWLGE